jgi:hypothetical protein
MFFFVVNLEVFGKFLNHILWDSPIFFCIIVLFSEAATTF